MSLCFTNSNAEPAEITPLLTTCSMNNVCMQMKVIVLLSVFLVIVLISILFSIGWVVMPTPQLHTIPRPAACVCL